MDPWSTSVDDTPSNSNPEELTSTTFQDNFLPPHPQEIVPNHSATATFAKLPDSEEYLASLERRLSKIQQQPNFLRSLQETKDAALRALLTEDPAVSGCGPATSHQEPQDEELKTNPLLLKLAPERIAVSTQELIRLLDADQLQLQQPEEVEQVGGVPSEVTPPPKEPQEE